MVGDGARIGEAGKTDQRGSSLPSEGACFAQGRLMFSDRSGTQILLIPQAAPATSTTLFLISVLEGFFFLFFLLPLLGELLLHTLLFISIFSLEK